MGLAEQRQPTSPTGAAERQIGSGSGIASLLEHAAKVTTAGCKLIGVSFLTGTHGTEKGTHTNTDFFFRLTSF